MKFLLTHGTPRISINGLNCSISADSQLAIDAIKIADILLSQNHFVTILTNEKIDISNENLSIISYQNIEELQNKFRYLIENVEYDGIAHFAWIPPLQTMTHRWRRGSETTILSDDSSWAHENFILEMNTNTSNDFFKNALNNASFKKPCNVICRIGSRISGSKKSKTISFGEEHNISKGNIGLNKNITAIACDLYAIDGICDDIGIIMNDTAIVTKDEKLELILTEVLTYNRSENQ
jgi:hypothetical protein